MVKALTRKQKQLNLLKKVKVVKDCFILPNASEEEQLESYKLFNGSVKKSEEVIATCKDPTCINPKHLKKQEKTNA